MKAPEFWFRKGTTTASLLTPAAALYDLAGRISRAARTSQMVDAKIICVGNLVAGGAGKTPVALALAEILRTDDIAFLTRGYGGRETGPLRVDPSHHTARDVGDEALLLAHAAPTWFSRDRPKGARAAETGGAKIVIMDDGFQNPSLAKNIALLVVDGATGFGNGRVMPAGPLRETVRNGLLRADAIVLVGDDKTNATAQIHNGTPILKARLVPGPEAQTLSGQRVLAFAGIGRPQKFFDTLTEIGCEIVGQHAFADHRPYRPEQIMALCEEAAALQAIPVTTDKDLVRLPADAREMVQTVSVTLEWDDPAAVTTFLKNRLA